MPRPIYNNKADIPAGFEDEYEEKDSKWHPKPPVAPDVSGLTSTIDREREKAAAERKARIAVEKERDDLKLAAEAAKSGLTEDAARKFREDAEKAAAPDKARLAALELENKKLKHTDRLRTLALKAGVMEDRIDAAMLVLERRTDLDEKGGIIVKDKDGRDTTLDVGTFLEKEFRAEAAYFYKGTGSAGSGSTGSDGGGASTSDAQAAADAVASGKAAAAVQKKAAVDNALAFR